MILCLSSTAQCCVELAHWIEDQFSAYIDTIYSISFVVCGG